MGRSLCIGLKLQAELEDCLNLTPFLGILFLQYFHLLRFPFFSSHVFHTHTPYLLRACQKNHAIVPVHERRVEINLIFSVTN